MDDRKVILLTSGDSEVGRRVALKLAKLNYRVAITGTNKSILDRTLHEIIEVSPDGRPEDFLAIETEELRSNRESNKKALVTNSQVVRDKLLTKFGRLDVLINNATHSGKGSHLLDDEFFNDFNNIIEANLKSAIHLTTQVRADLVKSGGLVINVAICGSQKGAPNFGYSISKAGLSMATKVLANAFSQLEGARVRVVGIESLDHQSTTANPQTHERDSEKLGHSESEEVAELIAFLISGESNFIQGSIIKISDDR